MASGWNLWVWLVSVVVRRYRRTGNVWERLIIANCEFFPDSQSLERKKLLLPGSTCTGCAAIAIIGNAISLFSLKRKHFTTHLKPVLRYIIDILIIIITFPYSTCISSFFGSIIPISLFIFKCFFVLVVLFLCNVIIKNC